MRPAQEGFDRDDFARREQIARLVVQLELVLLDGLRELLLPVEARERGEAQGVGIERDQPVLALAAAASSVVSARSMSSTARAPSVPDSVTPPAARAGRSARRGRPDGAAP